MGIYSIAYNAWFNNSGNNKFFCCWFNKYVYVEVKMTKFFLITIAILLCLFIIALFSLYIQNKFFKKKIEEQKEEARQQMNEINSKNQEILNNAKKKKNSVQTGNDTIDFNNSLNILQNIAEHGC